MNLEVRTDTGDVYLILEVPYQIHLELLFLYYGDEYKHIEMG